MAGGEGCYPWLIPAGKLVSAHRAWRHTLHGGCVSGGRQWGVAGLPTWCVSLPGRLFNDSNILQRSFHNKTELGRYFRSPHEHSLPNQHECCQKVIRHHQNGRTLTVECQTLPREAHPPGGEARHPPLAAATHPPSMEGGPPCTVGRDLFP